MSTAPKNPQEWWQEFLPTVTRNYLAPALQAFQQTRPEATVDDANALTALLLRISRDVAMLHCLSAGLANATCTAETTSMKAEDFLLLPSASYDDEKMKVLLNKLFSGPADGAGDLPWPGQYL